MVGCGVTIPLIVILGLDPRIQGLSRTALGGPWIAGSSPAMTIKVEV